MANNHNLIVLGLLVITFVAFLVPVYSLPVGPVISYISNSTAAAVSTNRSQDAKGTITVITLTSNQQDYKWKAYVGNVSGKLALDDGTSYTIYDWTLGTPTGEVYVTRASSINWANITCADQTVIDDEQTLIGMTSSASDSINSTFTNYIHQDILVGTKNIDNSTCRSIATYVNDTVQTLDEDSEFQEVLLADEITGDLVYTTIIADNAMGYNTDSFDFQLIVAENESSEVPLRYYFYVELG